MFIEISKRLSQAPEERHMAYVAPPELGELLCNCSTNISRLWRSNIREIASSIRFGAAHQSFADLMSSFLVAGCSLSYADQ
jgi:hypothetical protein